MKKNLLVVHLYKGSLPSYESSNLAFFNLRTNKLIKFFKVNSALPPSNLQQHVLLTDPTGKFLIVCDDYGISVFSVDRAFKLFATLTVPNSLLQSPIPYNRINQPLTRIRVLNTQEIIIAEGSSLLRWNFHTQRAVSNLPSFLSFDHNLKIADFECDSERNLLFVMTEMLLTCDNCEVILYDLADLTVVSRYKLDCMFLNRFWGLDMESGSISVIQSDLVQKKTVVSFLRLTPEFDLKKHRVYHVDGWALRHLNSSKEISCLVISQVAGNFLKRIWGFFSYAEDRFLSANYDISDLSVTTDLPVIHKIFDYLDDIGMFICNNNGTLFFTRRKNIIKKKVATVSKKFWDFVKDNPPEMMNSDHIAQLTIPK